MNKKLLLSVFLVFVLIVAALLVLVALRRPSVQQQDIDEVLKEIEKEDLSVDGLDDFNAEEFDYGEDTESDVNAAEEIDLTVTDINNTINQLDASKDFEDFDDIDY